MKQTTKMKRIVSLVLTFVTLIGALSVLALPASAANYSTNYGAYNEPENNDYARRGSKGANTVKGEICWIQAAINYLIKYRGLNTSYLDVDGSFGSATERAVKDFQKAYGLLVDGSCGPQSIAKLKQVLKSTDGFTMKNFLQVGQSWSNEEYGNGSKRALKNSGCGILSIVNAVYNLTGNFIQPTELASWAYSAKLYNKNGSDGCYGEVSNAKTANNVFMKAADAFGDTYGFKYVDCAWGTASSNKLKNHIKNGGTAIVHVPGHYMTIVDYDESTGKYLVYDPAPNQGKRVGLTKADGSWKTPAELSVGNIKIDRFYLYSAK